MSAQSATVAVDVARVTEAGRSVERPRGERRARDLTTGTAPDRRDERAGVHGRGKATRRHGDEGTPPLSDAEYVAFIDAAAPPLSSRQRATLAALLSEAPISTERN